MSMENKTSIEVLNTDLVIVGGGGAGMSAAIAAAEAGCSNIIVLEKAAAPGGNVLFAGGPFAAESPVQERNAIDAPRDEFFKKAIRFHHWKVDARIVRAFIDKSGDTIRWLEEKGLKFEFGALVCDESPLTWHRAEGHGPAIVAALRQSCENLGVRLIPQTQAKKILQGLAGNVTGVLAVTGNKEITVNAKRVIIATGGFGGNKDLLKKYCPEYHEGLTYFGVPYNTGDGLQMAMEIGAATEGLGTLLIDAPRPRDDRGYSNRAAMLTLRVAATGEVAQLQLALFALEPYTIWVNNRGRRFIDEAGYPTTMESAYAVNHQPGHVCYTLFDSSMRKLMSEKGIGRRTGYGKGWARAVPLADLEKELRAQADRGNVIIANSLNELAERIGADPKILTASVDEYNDACDRGYDPIFAKDRRFLRPLREAPYYAIEGRPNFMDTIGGIRINEQMEILDHQHNPIPGLYGAGVIVGGWEGETYDYELPGSALSFSINSGRIAGENAFKSIK